MVRKWSMVPISLSYITPYLSSEITPIRGSIAASFSHSHVALIEGLIEKES
jgi:hypothetical protein